MNPHFLFNVLNALAALSTVAPREVPRATALLRQFLRASFNQPERVLVPLAEELALVRVYIDIELLRFGDRLKVEQTIDADLLNVLVPPFSVQPLVENAVQHGLQCSPRTSFLHLVIRGAGPWLELSVSDDGKVCLRKKSNRFSLQSARQYTRWWYCDSGCKHCSGARFSWRCVALLERAPR